MIKPDRRRSGMVQTGLLGLIALLILIGGLLWGQRVNPFIKQQEIRVLFASAAGIGRGDSVYLNGLVVGSVTAMALQTNAVELTLRLPHDLPLTDDARFLVGPLDLMGGQAVFIENGRGGPFINSATPRQGVQRPGTGELLVDAEILIDNLNRLVVQLGQLLPGSEEPLPLTEIADEVVRLTRETRQLLADLQVDRQEITGKLNRVLDGTDTLVTSVREPMREMLLTGQEGLADFNLLVNDLQSMLAQPGTLQKLASDSTLYTATLATVSQLDSLLVAIGEHGLLRFHKE